MQLSFHWLNLKIRKSAHQRKFRMILQCKNQEDKSFIIESIKENDSLNDGLAQDENVTKENINLERREEMRGKKIEKKRQIKCFK